MKSIEVLLLYLKDKWSCYNPFSQPNKLQITINDEKYKLTINCNVLGFGDPLYLKKSPKLIIFAFSVTNPNSYKGVYRRMIFQTPAAHLSSTPIILIGDHTKWRNNTEETENQISTKKGEELARRIKAVKYMEWPVSIINNVEMGSAAENNVLMEIDWDWFRAQKIKIPTTPTTTLSFDIYVTGFEAVIKDVTRRFVFNERLNVVGDCLNEQIYFYDKNDREFFTLIEIDGEEHKLRVTNTVLNLTMLRATYPIIHHRTLLAFSVVKAYHFKLLQEHLKKDNFYNYPTIILVGYQTDLRNDSRILKKLSEKNEQPITFEMGEQLARDFNMLNYLECSSSDDTEIQNVFEEAVWTLLRDKEQERSKKSKRNRGFFKRLFKR